MRRPVAVGGVARSVAMPVRHLNWGHVVAQGLERPRRVHPIAGPGTPWSRSRSRPVWWSGKGPDRSYGLPWGRRLGRSQSRRTLAEGAGFEPARACAPPVFKTGAINRSATPPDAQRSLYTGRHKSIDEDDAALAYVAQRCAVSPENET